MATLKPYINFGPGDHIKDELQIRNWTQETLAEISGISLKHINEIINNKKPVTVETAEILSKIFGASPQLWINLDTNYRLRLREEKAKEKNNAREIEIKSKIYQIMPVNEMKEKGWLKYKTGSKELERMFMEYWNMKKIDFNIFESTLLPAFRKSNVYKNFNYNYAYTWFQMAKICSAKIKTSKYLKGRLVELFDEIPDFTKNDNKIHEFIERLNEIGIKFFVLSHLQHTYLDGASFLDNENPVIVYTKRHDRIDNFWFTLTHEIGHILKHIKSKDDVIVDIIEKTSDQKTEADSQDSNEKEADKFAKKCLKSGEIINFFEDKIASIVNIKECRENLNIGIPIIVGTLKFNNKLSWRNLVNYTPKVSQYIPKDFIFG